MSQPAFLGLRTVIYHVPDLQRAKEWYGAALGFPPYFDEPFYVGFNVGGYELGLLPTEAGGQSAGPGGVVAYWGVQDADAALARLRELGGPRARGGAGRRRRDPDGQRSGPVRQRVRDHRKPALRRRDAVAVPSRLSYSPSRSASTAAVPSVS